MDWTRGCTIGHGSSAAVSLATTQAGEVLAAKSVELSKSEFLQREQIILSSLSSPSIVIYMGCGITLENGKLMYNIFMEYISGGTLSDVVKRQGGSLNESAIRSYTRGILQGLKYLHSNGVVHCDIKGCNVLVGEDGVKIADLGCARRVVEDSQPMPIAGTPMFMAPEVARGEEQGFPADIWAVGCTLIEMATGCPPWPDVTDPISAIYRIGFTKDIPEIPSFLSEEGKDFLSKCLRRYPKERWTADQLLQHPFLDESNSNFLSSPTSILDQDFWNSVEEPQTPQNSAHNGCSNSPAARLQQLVEASSLPNWTLDETWVTIRSNKKCEESDFLGGEEISMISSNELAMTSGSNTVLSSPEVEMELCPCSVVDEISSMACSVNDISTIRRTRYSLCSRERFLEGCKWSVSNLKFEKPVSCLFNSNSYEMFCLFKILLPAFSFVTKLVTTYEDHLQCNLICIEVPEFAQC